MSNLRVYEAARKLNMQAGELVKILESKGIHASPIATISEEIFNDLLEELVGGSKPRQGEAASPLKLVSLKDKKEPQKEQDQPRTEGDPEEDPARPMLSLAPEMTEAETDLAETLPGLDQTQPLIPETKSTEETIEPVTEESAEEKPADEEPAVPAPAAEAAARVARPGRNRPSLVAHASFILAMLAVAGIVYVNNSVTQQSRLLGDAVTSIQAANARIDLADQANELQGQMIAANRAELGAMADSMAAQARLDARNEISAKASALEEMAPALPTAQAQRVRDIARRLAELGSGI